MRKVIVGIQARSDSERLPGKVLAVIDNKPVLDWILESCLGVIRYMRKDRETLNAEIFYMLLVPKEDPLAAIYRSKVPTYEGDKDDVLSRYASAAKAYDADYIVRITGDCQAIPTHIIAKHIKSALIKNRDYTTNTLIRTFKEGMDVQVFSKKLLYWLQENATEKMDLEHVGTLLNKVPFPFKDTEGRPSICHILSEYYEPDIKTSIDTKEDLDKARIRENLLKDAKNLARRTGIVVT